MTKEKWIEQFKFKRELLVKFLEHWHPKSRVYGIEAILLPITALSAEQSRDAATKVTKEVANFDHIVACAIDDSNLVVLYDLLSDAWLGVPESTSCWRIEGFPEAVALLEDPF